MRFKTMKLKTLISEKEMSDIDILDRLYSINSKWEDYIEDFYNANYPDAEDLTAISPRDLKKLLRDIRNMATKELESGKSNITDEELELLEIKITPRIAEAIYKNKLVAPTDYNMGWTDCYEMLKNNNLI